MMALAILLCAGIGREVLEFVRWKRRLNRMERKEWARVVRLLRE
jgi:hypothetical protein